MMLSRWFVVFLRMSVSYGKWIILISFSFRRSIMRPWFVNLGLQAYEMWATKFFLRLWRGDWGLWCQKLFLEIKMCSFPIVTSMKTSFLFTNWCRHFKESNVRVVSSRWKLTWRKPMIRWIRGFHWKSSGVSGFQRSGGFGFLNAYPLPPSQFCWMARHLECFHRDEGYSKVTPFHLSSSL